MNAMSTANHTLCIYSNNTPGILHRITVLFTRRKMNIESLTVSETETHGISRFTIVVHTDYDTADKVARQIRRIVDVHEVFLCRDEELVAREVALFKVKKSAGLEAAARDLGLRLAHEHADSLVYELVGRESEIQAALHKLGEFGVIEFVRSGRIAVRRDGVDLSTVLNTDEGKEQPSADVWI